MVDLHSHTDRSDGVLSPSELVELAVKSRLTALGVTDHDTIQGCDDAAGPAREAGLELIYGVELAAKFNGRSIHLLGYFLQGPPDEAFRARLERLKASRRERNLRLAEKLRGLGLDITLEEARSLGRDQTGRPHFARLLVDKGYCPDYRSAFTMYLDESAAGFVPRAEAGLEDMLRWIRSSGGLPVWAHPGALHPRFGREARDPVRPIGPQGHPGHRVLSPATMIPSNARATAPRRKRSVSA